MGETEHDKELMRSLVDPTALTTQQLLREISSLEKLLIGKMESTKELLNSRLEAVEKGIEIAHEDYVRVPTDIDKQVGAIRELLESRIADTSKLNDEKFKNIDKLLAVVEQARIEQKKDTATAVDAALKAAKEAVTEQNASNVLAINKTEASTTKQIDQQAILIAEIRRGFDEKIGDMKKQMEAIAVQLNQLSSTIGGKTQGGKDMMDVIKLVILIAGFIATYFILK